MDVIWSRNSSKRNSIVLSCLAEYGALQIFENMYHLLVMSSLIINVLKDVFFKKIIS